jgi:ribonuclease P protein component
VSISRHRLRNASEFDAVFKNNRYRVSSEAFLFLAIKNDLGCSRLGMVIGKKNVKLATRRNRVKRALRATFDQKFHLTTPSIDLVVVARSGVKANDKILMNGQIASLIDKLQLKLNAVSSV